MLALLCFFILVAYLLLEVGCSEQPRTREMSWFELVQSGQLVVSKKARTRGDVSRDGRTRRQRAHS